MKEKSTQTSPRKVIVSVNDKSTQCEINSTDKNETESSKVVLIKEEEVTIGGISSQQTSQSCLYDKVKQEKDLNRINLDGSREKERNHSNKEVKKCSDPRPESKMSTSTDCERKPHTTNEEESLKVEETKSDQEHSLTKQEEEEDLNQSTL